MESNKNLFWNKAMFWGFIVALAAMISTSIFYATGNMESSLKGILEYPIYIGGIILCAIAYKKTLSESDPFPYGRALGLGVATMLFASIILAVFNFVLYKFIDPNLIDQMLTLMEDKYLESGLDEGMVEQQVEFQRKLMTPAFISIASVFGGVLWGLIISLITSIFLQKKQQDGFTAAMSEIDDEE